MTVTFAEAGIFWRPSAAWLGRAKSSSSTLSGATQMSTAHSPLPVNQSDLVIRPYGEEGGHVVKDPTSGAYFQLGVQEHFLLEQPDGLHPAAAVCRAFEEKFAEPLSQADLEGFLALARRKGL